MTTASFIYVFYDHRETYVAFKDAVGRKSKTAAGLKLFLLWFIPIIGTIGTYVSMKAGDATDAKIETQAAELIITKDKIALSDERDKRREEAARPRGLVASRMPTMLKELEEAPKLKVDLGYMAHDEEAQNLAGQIQTLLNAAAITYSSNAALAVQIHRGVEIKSGNDEASKKLAIALARAISVGGVTVTAKADLEEGKVSIFVGKKP